MAREKIALFYNNLHDVELENNEKNKLIWWWWKCGI
jgi:hypothetical protein